LISSRVLAVKTSTPAQSAGKRNRAASEVQLRIRLSMRTGLRRSLASRSRGITAALLCATLVISVLSLDAITPEVIDSVDAIPPEIAGQFREPAGFQAALSGQYFVFDRRGHTVYGVDAAMTSSWRIVDIGAEPGGILTPTAFSVAPDGTFVVV